MLMNKMSRKYRNKFQQKTLLNIMNEAKTLYDRKLFTDVTLQCEGQEFPTHKVILIANSPYFREYFSQNENIGNVTIDFMTSEVLQIILDYFYSGRIIIDQEQSLRLLKSILEMSSVLEIPLLSNYCLERILNKQSSDLSLSDWKVIEELNSNVVFEIYLQSIVKKLNSLNTTQDFLQLSLNQINVLFQCPAVVECDQNIVLLSILNWIKYDSNGRKEQFTQLLETFVDLKRLNPEFLLELENDPLLTENMYFLKSHFKLICQQKKVENKKHIKINSSKNSVRPAFKFPNSSEVRTCKKLIPNCSKILGVQNDEDYFKNYICSCFKERSFFIYGSKNKNTGEMLIYLFDYEKNQLDEMVAHPLLNSEKAAVLFLEGNIYTFGGRLLGNGNVSRIDFSYNIETKQWMEKSWMTNYKHSSAAVELNGYIYVVGGFDHDVPLKCVELYNPAIDQWKSVADLPDVSEDAVPVVAVNDCLYIVLKAKLYKSIPEEDKWNSVDIELDKYIEGDIYMCTGNDKIFIIEKNTPKCVWIYDPKENTIDEDIIPATLTECDGILNLLNPGNLEFLVSGNEKWFIYRPPLSWTPFDPKKLKKFQISMLTLIHR